MDVSNINASGHTSAVTLTITAAITDSRALNALAFEAGLCETVEHNRGGLYATGWRASPY